MHLSQITPSLFASLGLSTAKDVIGAGQSPSGRELLFLIDGLGADVIGGMALHRSKLAAHTEEFAARLVGALATA